MLSIVEAGGTISHHHGVGRSKTTGVLRELGQQSGQQSVVVAPIGFISDHMEVVYDLDYEAAGVCDELDVQMVRAATVGAHPRFVKMIRELIAERIEESAEKPFLGQLGSSHDECPVDCCRYEPSRPRRADA